MKLLGSIILAVIGITAFICIRGYILNGTDSDAMGDALQSSVAVTNSSESTEPTEDPAFVAEVQLTIMSATLGNFALHFPLGTAWRSE